MLTFLSSNGHDICVHRRIVSFDKRINGLLHHILIQLSFGEQTPHIWFVTSLSELVSTVKILNIFDQNLSKMAEIKVRLGKIISRR